MRAIITKPLYRALKTTAERKAAFHTWVDAEAKREREEREARETRQKNDFLSMLRHQKGLIQSFTRFRTVAKLCGHLPAFNAVPSERQRQAYFDEYIQNMQREEKDRLRDLRKESMDKFARLLRQIPEITYKTSWQEAQELYQQQQQQSGMTFEGMDMLDFLSVFEEYHRQLWEEPLAELNKKIHSRRRKDRKAREGFRVNIAHLYICVSELIVIL
jgi:pre-mRNA-processing factor 40